MAAMEHIDRKAMERIELDLPPDARKRLAELAQSENLDEREYLRELVLKALSRASTREERRDFIERARAAQTPEYLARIQEIMSGIAEVHGEPR